VPFISSVRGSYGSQGRFGRGKLSATGGTITTAGGYTIHTFLAAQSGTAFVPTTTGTVEYLVIGGGGAGGGRLGGGGGAGRFIEGSLDISGSQTITVGSGGIGNVTTIGNNGANSVFSTVTAIGGGAGGGQGSGANPGGSGGGSSYGPNVLPGFNLGNGVNIGPVGFGFDGGQGYHQTQSPFGPNAPASGGGGGGAGGVGSQSTASVSNGGPGGIGRNSSITGASVVYAGGGGGGGGYQGTGSGPATGAPGSSIGGKGSWNQEGSNAFDPRGGAATANRGAGGGGGGDNSPTITNRGGDGGTGIVIIRYPS
jgi:hypothetical protein